jgi:DNA topoisomerase-1
MRTLIIVESYTKTKTIKKYLSDNKIAVTHSCGHIYNLPKDTLGINIDNWSVKYIPTNPKIISTIRKLASEADIIYIASDPDLEGEAIANHLHICIKDLIVGKECHRIMFNEITKNAIIDAINTPKCIDKFKVQAQETRRIVDRLIGYKISPLLWNKFNQNHLSAGRVQLAGLIKCIGQRNKITNKEIIPYWTIEGKFIFSDSLNYSVYSKKQIILIASMYYNNEIYKLNNTIDVLHILDNLKINTKFNNSYNKNIRKVYPQPPFTTTTMQQEAYNKYKFNAKLTMKLAQDLYENGLITYMRTDSTHIAEDAKKIILNSIANHFGVEYTKYRTYKTKIVNAQEAHEAIRVTYPNNKSIETTFNECTERHRKLYDLIWKRTLACQMIDAEYIDIKFIITNNNIDYQFQSTKSFLINEGFLKVYEYDKEDYISFLNNIENLSCYSIEYVSNGSIDNIPSMYNEVQLIKELEKEGIGRPSTYASIIDKLLEKKYIEIGQNPQQEYELECFSKNEKIVSNIKKINLGGKQKDLLIPTELGIDVSQYLFEITPYLCDLKFTSKLEKDLDDVMHQKNRMEDVLNEFYAKIVKSSIGFEAAKQISSRDTGIIKTKYGYCYYQKDSNRYTNIDPYLKWKKKSIEELNDKDITFIKSLPKSIVFQDRPYFLHIGKYGLYLKDETGNNIKLDKKLWNSYI